MTILTPITCEQFATLLADFIENDLDGVKRGQMEQHASSCGECGALLADIRELQTEAANLPSVAPSRDLWAGIAARIETPVVVLPPVQAAPTLIRRRTQWPWIGVAAAGLVGLGVLLSRLMPGPVPTQPGTSAPLQTTAAVTPATSTTSLDTVRPATRADVTPVAAPATTSGTVRTTPASNRPSAEETYDAEIRRLRTIVTQRRGTLDSATVAVIERNLKIIDDAIAQCREALQKDPASRFLIESLNDALDTKVHLLRTAAMLPART